MKLGLILLTFLTFSTTHAKTSPFIVKTKAVNTKQSKIMWAGEKYLLKDASSKHNGTVSLKSGEIKIQKGAVVGGNLVVDMTSIKNSDVKDEKWRKKLEGHLMSDDFFATAKHKEAIFKIQKVVQKKGNVYTLTGDLTIRETKKSGVSFDATITKKGDDFMATGELTLNRGDYGVTYNSEAMWKKPISTAAAIAKDKVIKDNFTLNFNLTTSSKPVFL